MRKTSPRDEITRWIDRMHITDTQRLDMKLRLFMMDELTIAGLVACLNSLDTSIRKQAQQEIKNYFDGIL